MITQRRRKDSDVYVILINITYRFNHYGTIYAMRIPPTKLLPSVKPAPFLALDPMDGMNTSRMLKVAAAVRAIIKISSTLSAFLGINMAQMATAKPSTKYLITRFASSFKSNISVIAVCIIYCNKLFRHIFS